MASYTRVLESRPSHSGGQLAPAADGQRPACSALGAFMCRTASFTCTAHQFHLQMMLCRGRSCLLPCASKLCKSVHRAPGKVPCCILDAACPAASGVCLLRCCGTAPALHGLHHTPLAHSPLVPRLMGEMRLVLKVRLQLNKGTRELSAVVPCAVNILHVSLFTRPARQWCVPEHSNCIGVDKLRLHHRLTSITSCKQVLNNQRRCSLQMPSMLWTVANGPAVRCRHGVGVSSLAHALLPSSFLKLILVVQAHAARLWALSSLSGRVPAPCPVPAPSSHR